MNKTLKIYAVIFAIVLLVLALLELNKTEITDWRKNFEVAEKTPFGLYVFNQEAPHIFRNQLIKTEQSPYDYYNENQPKPHNILVVERDIDGESWNKILHQVSTGSDVMVIAEYSPKKLNDTLGLWASQISYEDQQTLKFTDKKIAKDTLLIDKLPGGRGFKEISENAEIIGFAVDEERKETANFIKVKYGKGNFYLHTEPLFLTNYYLLKQENPTYLEHVFSYLSNRETIWFSERKQVVSSSPLRVVLANPSLKYAWWLFLASLFVFMFFSAKRKQRIVPIIEPLKNKSVEFVKSVGNLYLQEGDFHDMMAKKAQYFLHKVRTDLLLDTKILDEHFAKKIQLKTGQPIEKINEAIMLIRKAQDEYATVTKEDLGKMNRLLDEILK